MRATLPDLSHLPWRTRWRVRLSWAFGFSLKFDPRQPEWNGRTWFNLSCGTFGVRFPPILGLGYVPIWPYNAFNREYQNPDEDCWGFGLLQVGGRHLLGVISNEEEFKVDVGFVHVVHIDRRATQDKSDAGGEKR